MEKETNTIQTQDQPTREDYLRRQAMYREWKKMNDRSCQYFVLRTNAICIDEKGSITSRRLYNLYEGWCRENHVFPESIRAVTMFFKDNAHLLHIRYSTNIPLGGGKRGRGFLGIRESDTHDT